MTVLVTGGSGFVGLNLVEALLKRGESVVSCDSQPLPANAVARWAGLPGSLHSELLDVREGTALTQLVREIRPDRIIHAAAVSPAEKDELVMAQACVSVNIAGTVNLLDAAVAGHVGRVVIVSSAAVYGAAGFLQPELQETTPPQPASVYAASKFAAERIALRYRKAGLDVTAARLGSVFGPWEQAAPTRGTPSPMWQIMQLARSGAPVRLPRPGCRDWLYVRDAADAMAAVLYHSERLPEVVNIAAGAQFSVADFCGQLAVEGLDLTWTIDPVAPNVDFHGSADRAPLSIGHLTPIAGDFPRHDLRSAVRDYLVWAADESASGPLEHPRRGS
ncbi:MAG: NAD(P)-dependent oxidoreductase [Lautropia sp.]|nr:NAD(P)-dependent oxidoreductase [Lautropia sp.]